MSCLINSQALNQSKDSKYKPELLPVCEATYGIIFMSVPHRGSNWVLLAKNISALALVLGNADMQALHALDVSSETLERLRVDFAVLLKDDIFKIHTFQETKDMMGIPGLRGKVSVFCLILLSLADAQSRLSNLFHVSLTTPVSMSRRSMGTI
jgi:hypothetical protein